MLAFPTNDFHQELATNEDIQAFVKANYDQVTFPMFGLSSLDENSVYQALRKQLPDSHVQHNFFKYLVDRNGKAVKMFAKKDDPLTLVNEIEKILDQGDGRKHKLVTS